MLALTMGGLCITFQADKYLLSVYYNANIKCLFFVSYVLLKTPTTALSK